MRSEPFFLAIHVGADTGARRGADRGAGEDLVGLALALDHRAGGAGSGADAGALLGLVAPASCTREQPSVATISRSAMTSRSSVFITASFDA